MSEADYSLDEESIRRIAEAVARDQRWPINNALLYRPHKINMSSAKSIKWAMTPPGDEMLITPIADCKILASPLDPGAYDDPDSNYADVGGFWAYCAGYWPGVIFPISSNYFIVGGAWTLFGTADSGCDEDGYFDLRIETGTDPLYVRDVHSPYGPIDSGDKVHCTYKGGMGEYMANLAGC